MTMSRIYLDHAATTPMVPEAVEAMTRELTRIGNASSQHASGRSARGLLKSHGKRSRPGSGPGQS
jgi:cysteine desulfurase